LARFQTGDKKGGHPVSRVSIDIAHVTAVVAYPDGGILLRFVLDALAGRIRTLLRASRREGDRDAGA
jgi:hypothetical protein